MRRTERAPRGICGALLLCALSAALVVASLSGCAGMWKPFGREPADERTPVPGAVGRQVAEAYVWDEGGLPDDVPLVRVGLAHGPRDTSVTGRAAYVVRAFADTVWSFRAGPGDRWRFGAGGDGVTGSGPGGGFHFTEGTIRITPEPGCLLVFDGISYRGEIEIFASGRDSLTVVNVVDLESYLRGVVPKEIGPRPEDEIEAVKAQAVAARTYTIASSGKRASGGFDVFATVEDQVYGGADVETPVCDRAVLETAGLFMSSGGEPIHAYFHANCGGRTEARHEVWELPRVPYLESVWDTPDGDQFNDAYCSSGANFTWTETWTGKEIGDLVRKYLPGSASIPVRGPVGEVKDLRVTVRTPSRRVRWLEAETDAGTYRVFGDRVRWLLRRPGSDSILRSARFDLDVAKSGGKIAEVVAEGRGYGHGVGMCQHGAMEMARRGKRFDEILLHYYSGVRLERAYGAQ